MKYSRWKDEIMEGEEEDNPNLLRFEALGNILLIYV